MNVISVVVGIFAVGLVLMTWYVLQPAVYSVLNNVEQYTINQSLNRSESNTLYDILYYANDLWGPIVAGAIVVLWFFISSQEEDYRSSYEYP